MARNESYDGFVKKFEPKKTTDDCYTPAKVYEAVKDWAIKEMNWGEDDYPSFLPWRGL